MFKCFKCNTIKEISEFHKKSNCKRGHDGTCKLCKNIASKAWKKANPDKVRENNKAWDKANRDKRRENNKAWRKVNPDKANAHSAKRRATKREATPSYLTKNDWELIDKYYRYTKYLTDLTWEQYEVDHIIPISKGGRHTPWNLQVITRTENRQKGAKLNYSSSSKSSS